MYNVILFGGIIVLLFMFYNNFMVVINIIFCMFLNFYIMFLKIFVNILKEFIFKDLVIIFNRIFFFIILCNKLLKF